MLLKSCFVRPTVQNKGCMMWRFQPLTIADSYLLLLSNTIGKPMIFTFEEQFHPKIISSIQFHYWAITTLLLSETGLSFSGSWWGGELAPIPADTGQLRGSPWIKLKPIKGLTYKNKQPLMLAVTPMDSLVTD